MNRSRDRNAIRIMTTYLRCAVQVEELLTLLCDGGGLGASARMVSRLILKPLFFA
jgi:hypothetical protein